MSINWDWVFHRLAARSLAFSKEARAVEFRATKKLRITRRTR